jgi:hypothetical protein
MPREADFSLRFEVTTHFYSRRAKKLRTACGVQGRENNTPIAQPFQNLISERDRRLVFPEYGGFLRRRVFRLQPACHIAQRDFCRCSCDFPERYLALSVSIRRLISSQVLVFCHRLTSSVFRMVGKLKCLWLAAHDRIALPHCPRGTNN